MSVHVCSKTVKVPSDAAGSVDFHVNSLFASAETDFSWQVDVSGRKNTRIKESVDGAFTDHDGVLIGSADMMRGLLLLHQRGDKFIEVMDFLFGKGDTGSGFREKTEVFFVGIYCKIKVLFEGAGKTILAGIADIRWFGEFSTELSLEVLAESVAHGATFAEFVSAL